DDLEKVSEFYVECDQKLQRYLARPAGRPSVNAVPGSSRVPEWLHADPGNLLIVDDSSSSRQALRQLLGRQGHSITEAANGAEALEKMKNGAFDLVLLDLLMPGMDGYQVLQQLKFQPNMPQCSILVISGVDDAQSALRCVELGAEDYLTKPINH